MSRRTFVIGDIHGCATTFRRLLETIDLKKGDTLYLLGDYIDRGPDSRGVIETVLGMLRDGLDVRPVCGNHEDMMLLALRSGVFEDLVEWLEQGGVATLKSYGVNHPEDIPEEHIEFLDGLPFFRKTERYVFVHAGLDFDIDDPFSPEGWTAMLWDRSGRTVPSRIAGRKIVSGHSTKTLDDIRKSLKKNHIRIDNGCVYGDDLPGKGHLVALHLETGELTVQACIDDVDDEDG